MKTQVRLPAHARPMSRHRSNRARPAPAVRTPTRPSAPSPEPSNPDPAPAPFAARVEGPLLLPIPDVALVLGVGRLKVYGLIASGQLEAVHIGRSCRVPTRSVEEFVERLRAG